MSEQAPDAIRAAADARAAARAARDWATADRLRGEIEAAGWKVVDAGAAYRLQPAHAPDVVLGGSIRYGRSDAVPSRLDEPATRLATAIVIAREDPVGAQRAAEAVLAFAPAGVELVLVADGLADAIARPLEAIAEAEDVELLRTSARIGQGAALNAAVRRARGGVIVIVDASVELRGDAVTPLVDALADPGVAIDGAFGLASDDLRHFDEVTEGTAAAIEGYIQAFRREDMLARGAFDEGFRFYRNLDIWWSLVLRDMGAGKPPRRALVVSGLPLVRHPHLAWSGTRVSERDRLSKRNFYRVLDRFRDRIDLAVSAS